MITIIIPTYNEENIIAKTLVQLDQLREEANFEIIVSDGFSTDRTVELSSQYAKVIRSEKGKGKQLNAGAKLAAGDVLFFVHADMLVPAGALTAITREIYENDFDGGGFVNVFSSHNIKIKRLSRLLSVLLINNSRQNANIFYGDNGIFIKKAVFEALGSFREVPIMEDFDLSMRMRSEYRVTCIHEPKLILDPRRLLKEGCTKTIMDTDKKTLSTWSFSSKTCCLV